MKRLLALLVAVVLCLSLGNGFILAQETQPKIVIDGEKDDVYTRWKMLDHSYWNFYIKNGTHTTEPWDYERVKNTLWFDWDNEYIYLYFQAQNHKDCGDNLYQPQGDELTPPTNDTFFEQVTVCLDTAPSACYKAHCMLPHDTVPEEDECGHFCCNAISGEGASHRLMATFIPAWNITDAHSSTEEWEGVSFIDYQTNTYGFELKYPRVLGESYFQLNIFNPVNDKLWEYELEPELGYIQSFCANPKTNAKDLLKIHYDEYPGEPVAYDYEKANSVIDLLNTIPQTVTLEHKALLEQCRQTFQQLTPTQKSLVTNYEKLENAEYTMGILYTEWLISQFPGEFTQENKYLITQADEAYNALTNSQKNAVENRQNLMVALEEKRLLDLIEDIDNLPEILTKQEQETVEALWHRYNFLSGNQQRKVTNKQALDNARKTMTNLRTVVYGDVDENGSVNAKDALLALKYSVGKTSLFTNPKLAAEVDRVLGINAKDALLILKYAVGKIQEFPVEIKR